MSSGPTGYLPGWTVLCVPPDVCVCCMGLRVMGLGIRDEWKGWYDKNLGCKELGLITLVIMIGPELDVRQKCVCCIGGCMS